MDSNEDAAGSVAGSESHPQPEESHHNTQGGADSVNYGAQSPVRALAGRCASCLLALA